MDAQTNLQLSNYNKTFMPTAKECIDMLVTCDGNNQLAAELLTKQAKKKLLAYNTIYAPLTNSTDSTNQTSTAQEPIVITTADIVSTITADPDAITMLTTQMRTFALIKTLSALGATSTAFKTAIEDMDSKDIAHTLTGLIEQVSRLTDTKTPGNNTTVNLNSNRELIFKMLPPEMAEVIQMLALDSPQQHQMNIIEADDD